VALCTLNFEKQKKAFKPEATALLKDVMAGWCRHCHGIQNAPDYQKPREAAATVTVTLARQLTWTILKTLFCVPERLSTLLVTVRVELSRWTQ
jgi:hypothetical protein